MNVKIPIGMDDFSEVREGYYFVDKTKFLVDFFHGHGKVTLITRPRRFGKSLLMSMVHHFLTLEEPEKNRKLFDGLFVVDQSDIMKEQGTRPVVFLTLPAFLDRPMAGREVSYPDEPVYRFRELPGDGFLEVMSSIDDIYRQLRSFDYGRPELFFPLRVRQEDVVYEVAGYGRPISTKAADDIVCCGNQMTVTKDGEQISFALEKPRK